MSSDRSKPQLPIWKKAATNSNRNGNNDETASSAEGTNRNSATTTVTVRARSPRKMKTQIAKLVYDPATTHSNRDVFVNENETTPPVSVGEHEFQKKRQDRDREVKEIQEMLNEITNTPTKEKKSGGGEAKQPQQRPAVTKQLTQPVQRSKTEFNIRPPAARRNQLKMEPKTARSKSCQNGETESSASPKKSQKTYSSEEARRYMQEQKKKRKSLQVGTDEKPAIDRTEIKRRLDDLRKNTRQIVNKNVKMAQKKAVNKPCEEMISPQQVPPKEIQVGTARVDVESENAAKKKEQSKMSSPLSENCKKVGLLRKPEDKNHSLSAIKDLNMDKENLILDILTPQVLDMPTSRLKDVIAVEPQKPEVALSDKKESSIYLELYRHSEQPKKSDSSGTTSKKNNISELDLKIPEAKLRTHVSLREKSVQVDPPVQSSSKLQQRKNAELPYWLKPTAAQSYPYNFIMAVRKKLEAIASPPAVATSSIDTQPKRRSTETPVSYTKTTNAKRRLIESENRSMTRSQETLTDHRSEITSNFSSISIQLPESSAVSSLKTKSQKRALDGLKPLRFDEDDTTVSSSVFSSPEKKKNLSARSKNLADAGAPSPLSMANITNLHIQSKSMLSNVTLDRGDQFSDSSSHRRVDTGTISSRSDGSVNFSQLLDDFNRSLSQVIEVNHQLKTTLVKSHQIFSPDRNKRQSASELKSGKSVELAEYVSDFEESSNAEEKQAKASNGSRTSSSIPEIHTASSKSSPPLSSTEGVAEVESPIQSSAEEVQSQGRSTESLETHTFVVSSEDPAYDSPRTQTIYEEALEESPNKDNLSANQYSRDSLETSPREEYIKSHINNSRGDFPDEGSEAGPPPSYKATSKSQETANHQNKTHSVNSSLDSEFVRVFNKSDMEISVLSLSRSMSESTVNYSSIGLYEKLIQNETNKSEHLAALLKMREKALIDRTKGQIAWLEMQKKRYKAKGHTPQISAVKKKQRGILLKMEKERDEIKKLLQQAKVQRDQKLRIPESRPSTDVTLLQQRSRTGVQPPAVAQTASSHHQRQKSQHLYQHQLQSVRAKPSAIVRGYELETSRSLEQLLHKREEDLRRRREHVERLMEWHRRLDQEEAEVFQLERMLLDYNNVHAQQENAQEDSPNQARMEKKLKEIDRSLRELSSISGGEGSAERSGDFVRTTGSKLNKLWRRLTSRRAEKFEPNKRYKLCKVDLEQLYEEAKLAVLHDFGENVNQMEVFLSQTSISTAQQSIVDAEVPHLNLNFSSGQSDADFAKGNYSPSAAEEEFVGFTGPSTSEGFSEESSAKEARKSESSLPNSEKSSQSGSRTAAKGTRGGSSHSAKTAIAPESEPNSPTFSDPTNSASTGTELRSSTNTESNRVIQSVSSHNSRGSGSLAQNSLDTLADDATTADVSTKTESKQTNLSDCAQVNVSLAKTESGHRTLIESAKNNRASVAESILSNSLMENASLPQNSGSTLPDGISTDNRTKTESVTDLVESASTSPASMPKSAQNSVASAKTVSNQSTLIGTASLAPASAVTESQPESGSHSESSADSGRTENVLRSSLTSKTVSNQSGLAESYSNNGIWSASHAESEQVSLPEGPASKTQTESIPTAPIEGGTQTMHNSSHTNATNHPEGDVTPASKSVCTASPPESTRPNSQAESKQTESEKNSNYTQSLIASRNRSSEDSCDISSIVNSLLQCSGGTLISQNRAIAELSRLPSKSFSALELRSRTNGRQQSENITDPVTAQSEFNEATCATLRNISSIDNSTNSKHSASHSSKSDPSSIENTQSRQDNRSDITPSHKKTPRDATYSSAFDSSDASSNQVRSSVIKSTVPSPTEEYDSKTFTNALYESDFTEGEESNIDDVSLPKFETTGEEEEVGENDLELNMSQSLCLSDTTDLEKRLIDLDGSLKDLNATFEKALSPDKAVSPPRDSKHNSDSALMPDIISEVELGRRQQLMLENEMKQFEHSVPYMYVREIPNKPPPPYVPPAHGSPMTTIFPSEERIKDITYRRTKELYHEILHIDTADDQGKKPPSVLDENITNIYERIILDICKEYLIEYEHVLTSADPNNFHSPLAFFNPPDRLKCMQDFIYKEVRKSLAMDKSAPKRGQVYSVYGHRGKRDYVGEIIIQEMFEEDDQWSNFYVEEGEVLELIIEEMVGATVTEIATEVLEEHVPRDILASAVSAVVRSNST